MLEQLPFLIITAVHLAENMPITLLADDSIVMLPAK